MVYTTIVKTSHIKALADNLIPESRTAHYRELAWYVVHSGEIGLILGDTGPVSWIEGEREFMVLTGKNDNIKSVFLPISSNHLIVGCKSDSVPKIDFEWLNRRLAECCREYFVSGNQYPNTEYSKCMGKNVYRLSRESTDKMMGRIIAKYIG